jgi:hypothetical protein
MNHLLVRDCWRIIRETDPSRLNDARLPLANLDDCLAYFELSPLPVAETHGGDRPGISSPATPSFKGLTDEFLLALRRHLFAQSESSLVTQWAETLMRFCEVRYHSLRSRAISKCGSKEAAQLHLLHLAAFLMDQAIETRDVRPLNTTLKLTDIKWLLDTRTIARNLTRTDSRFVAALFQFRLVLTSEYALDQLSNSEFS